jgi:maltose operon protein
MKKARLNILLLACVLVSSCATDKPVNPVSRDLESAAVCCTKYEEFHFQELKLNDNESFAIDTGSPAFKFDGGESYFKAFSLPVQGRSYFIVVSSYFVDKDKRSDAPYIFSPVVMMLDAEFQVTRKVDSGVVTPINAGNSMNQATLEMEIRVNPRAADERFMVVYTRTNLLNQVTILKVLKTNLVGQVFEDHYPVQNAPVGKIQVELTSWRE